MRKNLFMLLILLNCKNVTAQTDWVWFQNANGSENSVKSITELNGYIWIAKNDYVMKLDTLTGLYEVFDQNNFPAYSYSEFNSIGTNGVDLIYVSYTGQYNGDAGLLVYNGSSWSNYPLTGFTGGGWDGMPLQVASNGHVFMAVENWVAEFDGSSWQTYSYSDGNIYCGAIDGGDTLWLGTISMGKILSFYDGNFHLELDNIGSLYTICSDQNGKVYSTQVFPGLSEGIIRYDHGLIDSIALPVSFLYSYSEPMITDNHGDLVFGFDGHVYIYEDSIWVEKYLPANYGNFTSIYCDSQNQLWLGYSNGHIIKLNGNQTEIVNASYTALSSDSVTSVASYQAIDGGYNVVAGTPLGIARIIGSDPVVNQVYDTTNSILADNNITCLSHEENSSLVPQWIGTNQGIYFWDLDTTWKEFNTQNSALSGDSITCIFLKNINEIWIGTRNGLAKLENDSVWTIYNTVNSPLPSNHIQCLTTYEYGMYIGTDSGMAYLKNNVWQVWDTSNSGLPSNDITGLDHDYVKLWVGTRNSGVCDSSFTSGLWEYYNTSNGFPSDSITFIKGVFQEFWNVETCVGTLGAGMVFINSSGSFYTVNEAEGIHFNNAYDVSQNDGYWSLQSWVGTEKGIVYTVIYGGIGSVDLSSSQLKAYFTQDNLIIQYYSDEKSVATVQIYDVIGKLLYSTKTFVVPGDNTIQLPSLTLNPQIYIVSLKTAMHREAVKVMKQ